MGRSGDSEVKVKALFLIFLLAGARAVRVGEESELASHLLGGEGDQDPEIYGAASGYWSDEYRKENQKCKWSTLNMQCTGADGGCEMRSLTGDMPRPANEQCRLSDAYMLENDPVRHLKIMSGLLKDKSASYKEKCLKSFSWANPKCKRRMQQMVNAMRFMSKAQSRTKVTSGLSEEDRQELARVYESSCTDLKGALGDETAISLQLKEKVIASGLLKKDPEGTVKLVMRLLTQLTQGSDEDKEAARNEIEQMPSSAPPPTAAEAEAAEAEAESLQHLEDEKGNDLDEVLDSADLVSTDDRSDEDPQADSSALEVGRSAINSAQKKIMVVMVLLFAMSIFGAAHTLAFAFAAYIFAAVIGCGVYTYRKGAEEDANATQSDGPIIKKPRSGNKVVAYGKCLLKVLVAPVKAVYQGIKAIFTPSNNTNGTRRTVGYVPAVGGGPR